MSDIVYMKHVIYTTKYMDNGKSKTGYKIRGLSGSFRSLKAAKARVRTSIRETGENIGTSKRKHTLFGKRK